MSRSSSSENDMWREREKLHAMLLSSVSHDLKTPLACVIGSLEIYQQLKNTLSEEHKNTLIATAIDEARHLDSFVTNILDMAKLEKGVHFTPESTDIVQLIRQCVQQIETRLREHVIVLELPAQLIAEVSSAWMSRALLLLLDNAARYTPAGTRIIITLSHDPASFSITVHDEGPGIPLKRRKEIFHKRERAKRQDAIKAGTGLGLPICKAIMEAHHGTIRLNSPVQGGTAFILTLPLRAQPKKSVKSVTKKNKI